jgi:alkylation response protein AidB-like acyl-CoA dehydrogenase
MQVFEFERTGTATAAGIKQDVTEFIEFCKETKRNGKSLWDDPKVKDTVAQVASEVEMHKLAAWETQWRFSVRESMGSFSYGNLPAALNKINGPRHSRAMLDIMGLYGQLRQGSKWAKLAGRLESKWRTSRSLHAGGSLQIQKMVLAERGLGLTRIPSKLRPVIGQAIKEAGAVRA